MALFALVYSSHLLWYWPLGKTWYHHTSLSSAPLSQELPILPNSFLERESWSQLYQMFLIAPSLIMPPSIQIRFGVEAMWKKVWLFTRSCFHAEFLEFQSYSTNRNYFDIDSKQTHSEEIQMIPMERFSEVMALLVLILVKNMKWHLDGHKSLEYQFEGYWELCFKAFILFAWIMILFRMRKHCLPIQIACLWSERAWLGT